MVSHSNQFLPGRDNHHVDLARPSSIPDSLDKVGMRYTFSIDSDDPIYEHDTSAVQEEETYFPKKPVFTAAKGTGSATFRSELPTASTLVSSFDPGSLHSSPSPMSDDCDPSDSLLIQASLYTPELENRDTAAPSQSDSAVKEPKSNNSSRSWHDWVVSLFAGRKPVSIAQSSQNKTGSSVGTPGPDEPHDTNLKPDSNHATTSQQPPQLLLRDVIPRVRPPRAVRIFHRMAYVHIMPATTNTYAGYAVVTQDMYTPTTVVRGFDGPWSPPVTSTSSRRLNTAANLLDRNGSTWVNWRQKITTPEDMPFARGRPSSDSFW